MNDDEVLANRAAAGATALLRIQLANRVVRPGEERLSAVRREEGDSSLVVGRIHGVHLKR